MVKGSIRKSLTSIGIHLSRLFISAVIIGVIIPFVIFFFIPIYLFRIFVSKLSKYVRPDLGKIFTTRSTNFSFDKLHEPNPASIIVVVMILEGTVSLESIKKAFTDSVLTLKLANGDIRYPELKQYPTDWLGFKFWKNDEKFDIQNHVQAYESLEGINDTVLKKLRQDALAKPFRRSQSPWEILLVNNYYPEDESLPHSVLLFRIHHSLSDGFSTMKLLVGGLFGHSLTKNNESSYQKKSFLANLIFSVFFPFRAVLEFSGTLLRINMPSPWNVPIPMRTFSVFAITNPISLQLLKKCKDDMGVSFSSVILSACAGAIKDTMTRKGIDVPDDISCVLPFPMPAHPDKLRNHVTQVVINLPLQSASKSEDRIKLMDESYRKLSGSTGPAFNDLVGKVVGGLFSPMVKRLATALCPSILISNLPANINSLEFEGHRMKDAYFYCGLVNMPAVSFFIASFNERVRIAVVAESSLMTPDEIQGLVIQIENELKLCINQVQV